jgi:hypothetical protein
MENGIRRLDFDLLPFSPEVIEQVGASENQRCFVADPDGGKFARLRERFASQNTSPPQAQILAATLYDTLGASPTREHCGIADFLGIEARITPNAMDELIRQEGFGRPVYYADIAIEGMESTTEENNEGQLIDARWALPRGLDHSRVESIQFHYYESAAYAKRETAPVAPTKEDFFALQSLIEQQLEESKRISWFAQILCVIGIVIVVLLFSRH